MRHIMVGLVLLGLLSAGSAASGQGRDARVDPRVVANWLPQEDPWQSWEALPVAAYCRLYVEQGRIGGARRGAWRDEYGSAGRDRRSADALPGIVVALAFLAVVSLVFWLIKSGALGYRPRIAGNRGAVTGGHLIPQVEGPQQRTQHADLEGGQLLQGRGRPVVVRLELVEHGGVGAAGTDGGHVLAGEFHRLLHLGVGVLLGFGNHLGFAAPSWLVGLRAPECYWVRNVPMLSPATTRAMFPGVDRLKNLMSRLLSRARAMAVASATLRSRARNSS